MWFDCTVSEFESQIRTLKQKGAVFVSTKQVGEALAKKKNLPPKAVCITFADNYAGFYQYAWPIIRREKIPVTQFVHTGFVGSKIGRPKMTWEQLQELDRSGLVRIASQTVSHPADLTQLTDAQLDKELRLSRLSLEKHLGHPVGEIAYPNGKFDSRVSAAAQRAGYRFGFTEECIPAESADSLLTIARYVHTKYLQAWNIKYRKN